MARGIVSAQNNGVSSSYISSFPGSNFGSQTSNINGGSKSDIYLNTLNLVSSLISSPPVQINSIPLWIIKPSQSSRGRGIYLIDDVSECPID